MATQLYKVLGPGRKSCHGGSHTWEPGVWYSVEGDLIACKHGFHLCRARGLLEWLHVEIWHAEARGKRLDGGNKSVVRSARITTPTAWDDTTARLFAADCADRALAVAKVTDARCHAAVNAARLFAAGCIDDAAETAAEAAAWQPAGEAAWAAAEAAAEEAARAAARAAAWAAAWDTARAAAGAAAWDTARAAAGDAAWAAAGDAARAAAGDAAWAAARAAAGDAAWAAAWDTARAAARAAAWAAAWAAARAAAGDAAWAAAGDAAWAAEKAWQTKRFVAYIEGRVDIERIIGAALAKASA
jgi:hypothetical protein